MKKFSTFAAAAALAVAAAAPVAAEQNDPFVSTQGSAGFGAADAGNAAVAAVTVAIIVASSDDS